MGLTPMMQQYLQIHEEVPDAVLLFRLGDFYEMFFDDALSASKELELTLTGRDCGLDSPAPMCGVPYHAAESYIAKLVEKGHKVAICEQVEDPKAAKGIVKREIIRIISPGTITDGGILDPKSNNYLMTLTDAEGGIQHGACAALLDLSTGDFHVHESAGEMYTWLEDLIACYKPSEILVKASLFDDPDLMKRLRLNSSSLISPYPSEYFAPKQAEEALLEQFAVFSLSSLGLADHAGAARAAGALIQYAREMQKSGLNHVREIEFIQENDVMALDAASRANLELTRTIRGGKRSGSLLSILDRTKTNAGARLLKTWLESPLVSKERIDRRLDAVEELYKDPEGLSLLSSAIGNIFDLERISAKTATSGAAAADFISLKVSAEALKEVKRIIENRDFPVLKHLSFALDPLDDLKELIGQAIEAPGGPSKRFTKEIRIKHGYNRELDELIDLTRHGKDYLMQIEKTEREKTGISTLKVKYNKVFGYFIEVSNGKKDLVPEYFIRKQTLANSERYFTEELKEIESKIQSAESELEILEEKLFQELQEKIREQIPRILKSAKLASEIDVYQSFATKALEAGYVRPSVTRESGVHIKGGRHPVVEKMTGRANFISNDTDLDENEHLILLTGPNMAGKSTYIRQSALIVLMAQIGSFVPADEAQIGICDRIFTRVGASDDLGTGQSTFMVEMTEVSNILRNATEQSLVILDEIGRGTSTFDGISIAWAICEELNERGVKTLFATHYHELTELEELLDGVVNYSIAVKETVSGVLFLRKIKRGAADQSYGIEVAKLAGFPVKVTDRAEEILHKLESSQAPQKLRHSVQEAKQNYKQLSFIVPIEQKPSLREQLFEKLDSIDPDRLTPREALNLLFDLKEMRSREE